jgi:tRNA pseudouridine38-40 synthase
MNGPSLAMAGQEDGERTFKLIIEYDGSEFEGWQQQPNSRTVQGELEKALSTLTGSRIRTTGSGRTDAGVHALGQVVSFHTDRDLEADTIGRALNALLPRDIRVLSAEREPFRFNARRDALARTYRYVLWKKPRAVGRHYGWYSRRFNGFDMESVRKASQKLIGEHDFSSFCKTDKENPSCMTRVTDVAWTSTEDEIRFEIRAVRFYHHMIRVLVGTLVQVGLGKITTEEFETILQARDRKKAGPTAPPHGLFFVKAEYPHGETKYEILH